MKRLLLFVLWLPITSISFASQASEQIDYINTYFYSDSWIRSVHRTTPDSYCCGMRKSPARKGCDLINSILHEVKEDKKLTKGEYKRKMKSVENVMKDIFPKHGDRVHDIEFETFMVVVRKLRPVRNDQKEKVKLEEIPEEKKEQSEI